MFNGYLPSGDGTLESWVMLTGSGNKVSFFSELDALIDETHGPSSSSRIGTSSFRPLSSSLGAISQNCASCTST